MAPERQPMGSNSHSPIAPTSKARAVTKDAAAGNPKTSNAGAVSRTSSGG